MENVCNYKTAMNEFLLDKNELKGMSRIWFILFGEIEFKIIYKSLVDNESDVISIFRNLCTYTCHF